MRSLRAEATVIVIVVLALIGGVAAFKPSWLPGASKRAAKSTEATAAVEKATAAVDKTVMAQGAAAAAIGVEIGVANGMAPDSPSKSFIGRELPLLASLLPPPDQTALLAAERRRIAVMEGNLDEARRLYESSSKEAARLQKERDAAMAARAAADAARRAADLALEKAAAAEHAKTMQLWGAGIIILLLAAGWVYGHWYKVKNWIPVQKIGLVSAAIRNDGDDPIDALDRILTVEQQDKALKVAQLNTKPAPSKPKR